MLETIEVFSIMELKNIEFSDFRVVNIKHKAIVCQKYSSISTDMANEKGLKTVKLEYSASSKSPKFDRN